MEQIKKPIDIKTANQFNEWYRSFKDIRMEFKRDSNWCVDEIYFHNELDRIGYLSSDGSSSGGCRIININRIFNIFI